MIQIVAWIGAITGLLGGVGLLFQTVPEEKRKQTRLIGVVLLFVAALNLYLATQIL